MSLLLIIIFIFLIFGLSLVYLSDLDPHRQANGIYQQLHNFSSSSLSSSSQSDDVSVYCSPTNGKKVYIDLGALDGDTIRVLWALRPDADEFTSIYAWECDPRNVKKLQQWIGRKGPSDKGLSEKQLQQKRRIQLVKKAAWVKDTQLEFDFGTLHNAGKLVELNISRYDEGPKRVAPVDAVDFARWLVDTVERQDFVVLKMDIEGAENQVLPHLFETGAIEYVDELQLEWHYWQKTKSKKTGKNEAIILKQKRRQIEASLGEEHNLWFQYATFDMDLYQELDRKDSPASFDRIPKYLNESTFPKPWVDYHYFRPGCHSTWSIRG